MKKRTDKVSSWEKASLPDTRLKGNLKDYSWQIWIKSNKELRRRSWYNILLKYIYMMQIRMYNCVQEIESFSLYPFLLQHHHILNGNAFKLCMLAYSLWSGYFGGVIAPFDLCHHISTEVEDGRCEFWVIQDRLLYSACCLKWSSTEFLTTI